MSTSSPHPLDQYIPLEDPPVGGNSGGGGGGPEDDAALQHHQQVLRRRAPGGEDSRYTGSGPSSSPPQAANDRFTGLGSTHTPAATTQKRKLEAKPTCDAYGDDDRTLDAPLLLGDDADGPRKRGRPVANDNGDAVECGGGSGGGRSRSLSTRSRADGSGPNRKKSPDIVDRVKDVACTVLDALPSGAAKVFVRKMDDRSRMRLHDFQEAILVPFNAEDREHQRLIPALWNGLVRVRPPLPFAGEMDKTTWQGELWKDYGFQGVDPATDFRGAGLIGLRSLVWLCNEEPDLVRAMLDSGYPFAIAAINVVMSLLNMLRLTKGRKTCLETTQQNANFTSQEARAWLSTTIVEWAGDPAPCLPPPPGGPPGSGTGPDAIALMEAGFLALAVEYCRGLHGEWLRSKQNVMEFNLILKVAKGKFEHIVRDKETYDRIAATIDKRYPDVPASCAGI